ncbi:MAG TPA: hypothetical protein VLA83_09395 [Candidatus Binatia bacterium]|nr:hypothetical protein [Candidatus Binatia bacterium]
MSRPVYILPFLAFALQVSLAQTFSHGAPASVVSPTADGRQHGVPASVVSPTQLPFGVHPQRSIRIHGPLRRFGNPRSHRQVFLPIPVFYPYYSDESYPSAADPYVPENAADPAPAQQASGDRSDDELRAAYLQGARDALSRQADSRYGEHYTDSRERRRQQPQEERKSDKRSEQSDYSDAQTPAPVEDKTPAAVFIFKDGHQLETKNYAIMGGTLFDFSSKTIKKIQLDEIDSAATLKANDDRGVTMKLN